MLRLILDTNVVLDLFHFADPAALPILLALESGRARCLADAAVIDELRRVVRYPEFGLSESAGAALVERYLGLLQFIPEDGTPPPPLPRCRDRDDQKFLELAARTRADLLVSKDKALLKLKRRAGLGFRIAMPGEAAGLLRMADG